MRSGGRWSRRRSSVDDWDQQKITGEPGTWICGSCVSCGVCGVCGSCGSCGSLWIFCLPGDSDWVHRLSVSFQLNTNRWIFLLFKRIPDRWKPAVAGSVQKITWRTGLKGKKGQKSYAELWTGIGSLRPAIKLTRSGAARVVHLTWIMQKINGSHSVVCGLADGRKGRHSSLYSIGNLCNKLIHRGTRERAWCVLQVGSI